MWYAILGAVLLAGDQILKYWVVTHLAVGESAPFLPGFMQLTRLHNYGAAWSSFSGRTVLLVVFTAVFFRRTRAGLSYKAVGEHPKAAATLGINVIGVKYIACMICGALAGMGGA